MASLPVVTGMPQWMGWLYGAIAAVAAVTDFRAGKIYNWLTLPALLLGMVVAIFCGWATLAGALQGMGLAAVIFIPLFFVGIFGGGDVKLLMALGTVLGAYNVLVLICTAILVAAAGAVALLIAHRRVRIFALEILMFFRTLLTPGLTTQWPQLSRDIKAPFGIAIFLALVYVLAGGGL